jgi:primosomal protein N' (replication factor Y) (superfamily II helicase)
MRTFFVDVVVPIAVPRLLTYRVPADWENYVQEGVRVVVPLGKSKKYTGIVWRVHEEIPREYEAKYMEEVLDEIPIISTAQKQLWEWISSYYACTLGEVMSAALPTGLKLSSETVYVLKEYNENELDNLEFKIVELLKEKDRGLGVTLKDIQHAFSKDPVQRALRQLIKRGCIASAEEVKEKFVPKKEKFIALGEAADTEEKLNQVFEKLEKRKGTEKLSNTLIAYLQLSKWNGDEPVFIERKELEKTASVDSTVIRNLVQKNYFVQEERAALRMVDGVEGGAVLPTLSAQQQEAFDKISSGPTVNLLHGVTSSGKTEVYVHLIEEMIKAGKQVLFLLPEIALTSHLIHRVKKYFGAEVGVYHSGYSTHERTEVWHRVYSASHRFNVVLGARSSLFLPFENLGLIIVDEEHENTFKQQDPAPRYNGRDAAIKLAQITGAKLVLGSATPSLESYANAEKGKYQLVEMPKRYGDVLPPKIELINLRTELQNQRVNGTFSTRLLAEILATVQAGKQVILFQNRRGYTPLWECEKCNYIPECKHCDVSLTYHKHHHELRCHYCGYTERPPTQCPKCATNSFKMLGAGTEKIEEELRELLPHVRVSRLDLDVARGKNAHHEIITDFEDGKTDVLIGTQMVSKGLDFTNVQLVGILNADRMMKHPDFRSIERSFQMILQVSGRSGRRDIQGKVLIQTYDSEHWIFPLIMEGDYTSFYRMEMAERLQFRYPPHVRMVKIVVKHKELGTLNRATKQLFQWFEPSLFGNFSGPETPSIGRINNQYIQQFWIRIPAELSLPGVKKFLLECEAGLFQIPEFKSVRMNIDVDPM